MGAGFCSLYRKIHYIEIRYIKVFRFYPTMNRENDDDAYFYGPILFLKRGDFGGTLRS